MLQNARLLTYIINYISINVIDIQTVQQIAGFM